MNEWQEFILIFNFVCMALFVLVLVASDEITMRVILAIAAGSSLINMVAVTNT